MNRSSLLVLALAGALTACQQEAAEETGTTETTVATDPAAIEQEIRALTDEWEAAFTAHDGARVAALYDADAVAHYPGGPPQVGAEAIRASNEELFATAPDITGTADTERVIVSESGDLAVEFGAYTLTGTGYEDRGSYMTVWRNTGEGWKAVAVSTTPAAMPTSPEATTS